MDTREDALALNQILFLTQKEGKVVLGNTDSRRLLSCPFFYLPTTYAENRAEEGDGEVRQPRLLFLAVCPDSSVSPRQRVWVERACVRK